MPRYPFSPELLDALPEELAELYRGLEDTLLEEICSRLKIADQLNEVTVQDIKALRSHGIDLKAIKKAIAETANISIEKLDKLFDDVVARNQAYYTELIDLAAVTAPETLVDHEAIYAIYEQTRGELRNITRSMGFLVTQGRHKVMLPPAKFYQWALDHALLQVESEAISYNQAISRAVRALAGGGLKIVDYESGHHDHIDVAARRAVMTGVNQINQRYREQSMDYLGTDLVEVTAHRGARNTGSGYFNHEGWQGKVYHWNRDGSHKRGKYPDFEEACGYGEGGGIGGWNCRHSFWPCIDGVMEPSYSKAELDALKADNFKFEYQGKVYDGYTSTQQQRKIERTIRKQTRLRDAYKAAGLDEDATDAGAKLRTLNREYKAFSQAAGLPEQRERMKVLYVDDASKKVAATLKVKRDAEAPIREAIRRGDYSLTINPEKQARHMNGTAIPGRSVITISQEELQDIINKRAGSGHIELTRAMEWRNKEIVDVGKEIGYTVNARGDIITARSITIHYSKTGVHAVPNSRWWKK